MRRVLNGVIFASAACGLMALTGCASIESVEQAQATADRALIRADQAMAAADRAQQTASNAQASANGAQAAADRATQVANAAQASSDRAVASLNESRTQITALNEQVESQRSRRGMRD